MTLLIAVLAASLLGSVHCAAMCGAFVCVYARGHAGESNAGMRATWLPHVAYNGGRLVSYLALGAVAGTIGVGVDRIGPASGTARLAAVVAGTLMVLWGAATLLAASGIRVPQHATPRVLQAALTSTLVRFRHHSPVVRAAATGLLTTLLPCGWLYVFVATAGGTGHVVDAVAVMAFFWLGTLPMMLAVGLGAQRAFGRFQRRLPLVSAGAVVVLGVLSIVGRMPSSPLHQQQHTGHDAATEVVHDRR